MLALSSSFVIYLGSLTYNSYLGKYISEGTFGKLYSGINVKTNEEVAVKLVLFLFVIITVDAYIGKCQYWKPLVIVWGLRVQNIAGTA